MIKTTSLLSVLALFFLMQSPVMADDVLSAEPPAEAKEQPLTERPEEAREEASTESAARAEEEMSSVHTVKVEQPPPRLGETLSEFVLRPIGAISNLVGVGLFVAALPFTALASIPEPHDAVKNSLNGFVLGPFRYTFVRPIGVYEFQVNAQE